MFAHRIIPPIGIKGGVSATCSPEVLPHRRRPRSASCDHSDLEAGLPISIKDEEAVEEKKKETVTIWEHWLKSSRVVGGAIWQHHRHLIVIFMYVFRQTI